MTESFPRDPSSPAKVFDKPVMASDFRKPSGRISALGVVYFQRDSLKSLVMQYVNLLETQVTKAMCKCTWRIHPDDMHVGENCCRHCNHALELFNPTSGKCEAFDCGCTRNTGRRMVLVDGHAECPVHTKDGFLLGFFEWATGQDAKKE